ncbi:hypothetical protein MTO96_009330 [Rhipicephalus appendiculatus]
MAHVPNCDTACSDALPNSLRDGEKCVVIGPPPAATTVERGFLLAAAVVGRTLIGYAIRGGSVSLAAGYWSPLTCDVPAPRLLSVICASVRLLCSYSAQAHNSCSPNWKA